MIDSNVIISAARNPFGVPHRAYLKAATPPNEIVLCSQIVEEVESVFARKFPNEAYLAEMFFSMVPFDVVAVPEEPSAEENSVRDPKDRPILRAAIAAGVDAFVTGDKDFLEARISFPLVMTPLEFLEM